MSVMSLRRNFGMQKSVLQILLKLYKIISHDIYGSDISIKILKKGIFAENLEIFNKKYMLNYAKVCGH